MFIERRSFLRLSSWNAERVIVLIPADVNVPPDAKVDICAIPNLEEIPQCSINIERFLGNLRVPVDA